MNENLIALGNEIDSVQTYLLTSPDMFSKEIYKKILCDIDNLKIQHYTKDELIFHYYKGNYYSLIGQFISTYGCKYAFENFSNDKLIELRINYTKKSIEEYNICLNNSKLSEYVYPILTNYCNTLMEMGRVSESIESTLAFVDKYPVIRLTYARSIFDLSLQLYSSPECKYLLLKSRKEYIKATNKKDPLKTIHPEQYQYAKKMIDCIDCTLQKMSDVPSYVPSRKKSNEYKKWCSNNRLTLNLMNTIEIRCVNDDLILDCFNIGSFSLEKLNSFQSQFNTIKQEYNFARYQLYLSTLNRTGIHESQKDVLIVITRYESVGYKTELLKSSIKGSHGIFDKIAQICYSIFETKPKSEKSLSLKSWIEDENNIKNSFFLPILFLIEDLKNSHTELNQVDFLRNILEHRILHVYENYEIPWTIESKDRKKREYSISISELENYAFKSIILIRDLIFSLKSSLAKTSCYNTENTEKIMFNIPYYIDTIEDEWKN